MCRQARRRTGAEDTHFALAARSPIPSAARRKRARAPPIGALNTTLPSIWRPHRHPVDPRIGRDSGERLLGENPTSKCHRFLGRKADATRVPSGDRRSDVGATGAPVIRLLHDAFDRPTQGSVQPPRRHRLCKPVSQYHGRCRIQPHRSTTSRHEPVRARTCRSRRGGPDQTDRTQRAGCGIHQMAAGHGLRLTTAPHQHLCRACSQIEDRHLGDVDAASRVVIEHTPRGCRAKLRPEVISFAAFAIWCRQVGRLPPSDDTRWRPFVRQDVAKMMLPSSLQVAPRLRPSTQQIGRAGPPVMFTFLSATADATSTKPIHWPSGERNGAFGVPSPASGVGSS